MKPIPMEAIGQILNEVMELAVKNGANSISMPDEYVAVAHFIAYPDQYLAPSTQQAQTAPVNVPSVDAVIGQSKAVLRLVDEYIDGVQTQETRTKLRTGLMDLFAAAPSAPANSEDAKDKERTRLLAQAKKDVATVLRVEGLDLEIGSRKLLKEVISAIDAATAQQKGGE